jgi:hypothetical protein
LGARRRRRIRRRGRPEAPRQVASRPVRPVVQIVSPRRSWRCIVDRVQRHSKQRTHPRGHSRCSANRPRPVRGRPKRSERPDPRWQACAGATGRGSGGTSARANARRLCSTLA